jgi:hypothetical protein
MDDIEQGEKPKSKYTNRGGHGGPVGNQKRFKHGYYSLVRLIKETSRALDKRTVLVKMVVETVQQLEADLGGDLSTAQRMLVEDVALDTLLLRGLNKKIVDVIPVRKGKSPPGLHATSTANKPAPGAFEATRSSACRKDTHH